ncbi:MAG: hypothetical protein LBJ37_00095 [Paucimonas sp.]|jgi:Leucine-rich repeat (LRR) protein|nr:hypothetical protein [Paucimonas sp.]
MSVPEGSETTPEARHHEAYAIIAQRTPQALLDASSETRRTLRKQAAPAIDWYTRGLAQLPQVVARLHEDHREHQALGVDVEAWLRQLADPEGFAAPLLTEALRNTFDMSPDLRQTYLFAPVRMRRDDSFLSASRDWLVESDKAFNLACRPLLNLALQNFDDGEAQIGGMDLPRTRSRVFRATPGQPLWQGETLDIEAWRFAAMCRELDLGARFQQLIQQTLSDREASLQRYERTGLLVHLHLARLRGDLDGPLYDAACRVVQGGTAQLEGVALTCGSLTLWNVELRGIVIFGADRTLREGPDQILVYIPGDPQEPLRVHDSFLDFCAYLRDRLGQADYLAFFLRLIPLRQRAALLEKLHQAFNPKVWNAGGWFEQGRERQPDLPLREAPLEGPLMAGLVRRKIAGIKDDGLFCVVPTAARDHKSLVEKLDYFAQSALVALNVIAFAVPVIGAAMLVVGTLQLAQEVYEGIGEWTRDEREKAWTYLLDVVENLALMAALGAAGSVPRLPEGLQAVRLADGRGRLWSGNLAPFAHDIELPSGLQPDARGLYAHQGRQWLRFDGRSHAVVAAHDGSGYLEHPWRRDAYRPAVRYHGGGVWLHELDRPQGWSGLALFQRFGTLAQGLDEAGARQMLVISGCHEAQLRQTLVAGQRPPALLLDCLERYQIHRALEASGEGLGAFDQHYRTPEAPASAAHSLVLRDFANLPRRVVQELLTHATAAEWTQLREQQRVPSRLAEEARVYLQALRLARAYEGLYLKGLGNHDSGRLILHSLAALPGWAEQYRIEVRALRADGPLLDSIGPSPAVHRRVLVKGGDGYRLAEEPEGRAGDLFEVVLATLTEAQRRSLGLAPGQGGKTLRDQVVQQPLGRPALRKVLHMQPIRPASRSPMRLADGRPGYPLSGRGRLGAALSENTLLDNIRQLELPDVFATDLLQQLRGFHASDEVIEARLQDLLDEHAQMRQALPLGETQRSPGTDKPALSDRQLIELALWQHWRDNLLPEIGRSQVPLRLFAVSLESFPESLPAFFRTRVQALELVNVSIPAVASGGAEGGTRDLLANLLRGFPRVSALELDALDGRALHDVPRLIVGAYPRLVELRLLNLQLPLAQEVLDELGRLGELRHLDLSGNRPGHLPVRLGEPLRLDFLGLDRLGLDHWPEWLDTHALDHIGRISLRDNRLTDLPMALRVNPAVAERSTWISLRGNLFSHRALIGIRASAWSGRRFVFELDVPQTVENIVEGMMVERQALSTAIDAWLEGSSAERRVARRSLGSALLAGWMTQSDGSTVRSLVLEDLRLEDFPEGLPAFYFERISRLELIRPVGDSAQLDSFVARFTRLERLSVAHHALERLPSALDGLLELHQLALTDAQLLVDQRLVDGLARIRGLSSLDLSGNRLGEIRDVTAFGRLSLNLLGLERMDISRWPAWLDGLLPERIQWLNLNHNRLATLPGYLLENAETASGSAEISLEGNPLSEETMFSAHLSEGPTRPYTFHMDLPEHLRRLGGSWRGSSSGAGSSGGTSEADLISVDVWLKQGAASNDERRKLWRQVETSDEADDLLRLIGYLRHTAEYRNGLTRPDLVERVWQVLTVCAEDAQMRLVLNGMAEEPLRQLRDHDTCPDGIRLEFNQMEVLVFTNRALRAVTAEGRGAALYRLMRRLYRLQELDRIARHEAGSRDEAEVRLAYRLQLANSLDLPLAPEQMLYAGSASLHPGELDRVAAQVRQGESGQALLDYAAQRDFWLAYLRDVHEVRFRAVREAFEAQVLGLDELYPDDTPVQTSARIQALVEQRKGDEAKLIGELTHQEGLLVDEA